MQEEIYKLKDDFFDLFVKRSKLNYYKLHKNVKYPKFEEVDNDVRPKMFQKCRDMYFEEYGVINLTDSKKYKAYDLSSPFSSPMAYKIKKESGEDIDDEKHRVNIILGKKLSALDKINTDLKSYDKIIREKRKKIEQLVKERSDFKKAKVIREKRKNIKPLVKERSDLKKIRIDKIKDLKGYLKCRIICNQ